MSVSVLLSLGCVLLGPDCLQGERSDAVTENAVFELLVEQGLPAPNGERVKLPRPWLPDGLDATGQRAALKRMAGPNRSLDQLLRNSVVAPFVFKMANVETAQGGDTTMRRVDIWFVAYGDLDKLAERKALDQMAESLRMRSPGDLPQRQGVLDEQEMRSRGLFVPDTENRKQRFAYATVALFDRVLLSATQRVVLTRGEDSLLVAGMIDPRLTNDSEYPNQWRPVERNASGTFKLGPSQPYTAAAFYVKVTPLKEPAGALVIECHQVFDEPRAWFGGRNLLRSKLPILVQDAVRKFRRKLRELSTAPQK